MTDRHPATASAFRFAKRPIPHILRTMAKSTSADPGSLLGFDLSAAAQYLRREDYGDWYQDPWAWPELDATWVAHRSLADFSIDTSTRIKRYHGTPSFTPMEVPKSFLGTRPAVVQDPESRLIFTAAALRIAKANHRSLPDWVFGWRYRSNPDPERNSDEWALYSKSIEGVAPWERTASTDITSCFASIDHKKLIEHIASISSDNLSREIVSAVLDAHSKTAGRRGLTQRSNASSLIAQFAFAEIDECINSGIHAGEIKSARRWMDDISLEGTDENLVKYIQMIQQVARLTGLEINGQKTRLESASDLWDGHLDEKNALIEVPSETIEFDDAYEMREMQVYDYSVLEARENRILARPRESSRAAVGRVIRSLIHYELYERVDEWAEAACAIPHGADHLAKYLRAAHNATGFDVSSWYDRTAPATVHLLPWVRVQHSLSVPIKQMSNDYLQRMSRWLAESNTLIETSVAAARLIGANYPATPGILQTRHLNAPPAAESRIITLGFAATNAPHSRIKSSASSHPTNRLLLEWLEENAWKPPKLNPKVV